MYPIKVYELIIHQNQGNSSFFFQNKFLKTIEGGLPPLLFIDPIIKKILEKFLAHLERFDLQ